MRASGDGGETLPATLCGSPKTADDVVAMFRASPEMADVVRSLYWDDNVYEAAKRFRASAEFAAVRRLVQRRLRPTRWDVLDLGAGVGISSYAFAADGHRVIAVEPDPSDILGRGAFARIRASSGVTMDCVEGVGEHLPVADRAFDLVYTRQVLHHAMDLGAIAREFARVLRPGGIVLATREHVVSRPQDLSIFLAQHLTHRYLGNEHAFLLEEYLRAFRDAGLKVLRVIGPRSSIVNRFPITDEQFARDCFARLERRVGSRLARFLSRRAIVRRAMGALLDAHDDSPGRMYSFLLRAPRN